MDDKKIMEIPKILLFDCDYSIKKELENNNYFVKEASFGKNKKIAHKHRANTYVPLNLDIPDNIHEFDIFIVDMAGIENEILINSVEPEEPFNYLLKIEFPNKYFYNSTITSKFAFKKRPQKGIYIVFAAEKVDKEYEVVKITAYSKIDDGIQKGSNYDFFSNIIDYSIPVENKSGNQTKIIDSRISSLFIKYDKEFTYTNIFEHPLEYIPSERTHKEKTNFIPLILNKEDEIVSFMCWDDDNLLIVLPQLSKKNTITSDILNNFLATVFSEKFPELTQFSWLDSQKYMLPNEKELKEEIVEIEKRCKKEIGKVNEKIEENKKENGFLHDLITETDTPLVDAVIKFLEWLEFKEVIDTDKETGEFKEDIDINDKDNVLIIEVKGLGGTSTDKDCAQIAKHRRRHEKSNPQKNIYPIYIVNHQRYLPPHTRENPPFTKDQIEYAEDDERGLITTFQLYKWYYMHGSGILTKEEIRNQFLIYGSIDVLPENYKYIDTIKGYYPQKNAAIITLKDFKIKIGDSLVLEKDGEHIRTEINSIQLDNKAIDSVASGEVGVVFNKKVSKGWKIYKKV